MRETETRDLHITCLDKIPVYFLVYGREVEMVGYAESFLRVPVVQEGREPLDFWKAVC